MKLPSTNAWWYALVAGLAIALVLLAFLQYRSSRQIREATIDQMLSSLQGSLMDVRDGLERELSPLCRAFQMNEANPHRNTAAEYVEDFNEWRGATNHPDLVSGIYFWQRTVSHKSQLFQLDLNQNRLAAMDWPEGFRNLRERLDALSSELETSLIPASNLRGSRSPVSLAPQSSSWMIDQNIPALVHGIREKKTEGSKEIVSLTGLIVQLNSETLGQSVFPEIVQRYFGKQNQSTYEVAIVRRGASPLVFYSSDDRFGVPGEDTADAALNLFGPPVPVLEKRRRSTQPWLTLPGVTPPNKPPNRVTIGPSADFAMRSVPFHIDPLHYPTGDWELLARHQSGSVDAAVTALHYRSLAINFGVLLLLTATTVLIIVTSQRARRLAQLQMDFVAGVSHELRTPLTGIVSAAENIADGVVRGEERVSRYGAAILMQAQQLSDLVEQILLFAATERNGHRYVFQMADVEEVIEAAIRNASPVIRNSGSKVEREIPPDLPQVVVDFRALTHCLQNLITNAIKYGGDSKWVGIRASTANGANNPQEVRITISDKGMGIEPKDLERIFEPFYRTEGAASAQIHGSGLGLPLAKTMVEAMGGRLTVESVPQQGSAFTIHLPVKSQQEAFDQLSAAPS